MLELRRKREALAQMRRILVGAEARAHGRDLEQHAIRHPEVDRLEVEAVDDRRRPGEAGGGHAALPGVLLVAPRRKGDVRDGAGTLDGLDGRRLVPGEPAAAVRAAHVPAAL